jgi:Holliday junction resolvase RusA-like endonuclease
MEIVFRVDGLPPSKSNSYKTGRGFFYKDPRVTNYERVFALVTKPVKRGAFWDKERLGVRIDWTPPHLRSDIDGICKILLDSCQKNGIIKNDNKVDVLIVVRHKVDKKYPHVVMKIWGIDDPKPREYSISEE